MNRLMPFAVLTYLGATLLLGGASSAGYAANYALQLIGAVLIGIELWGAGETPAWRGVRYFTWVLVVLVLVQFMPLPPAIWTLLPGRDRVAAGFDLLGMQRPWLALSLAPWSSLASLTWSIPALATFVAMRGRHAPPMVAVAWLVVALAVVSVVLGLVQEFGGSFYIYGVTNYGLGPGFFANCNHQSSFLLMALALGAGASIPLRGPWIRLAVPVLCGSFLVIGVLTNRSLACIALLPVAAVALLALARPDWRRPILIGLPVLALAAIGIAVSGLTANDLTGHGVVPGISRHDFLINGIKILRDFGPFGSGLGSFPVLYRWYENPALVGSTFVNHAHDDLLELLIETGVFGALAVAAFFCWFIPRAVLVWRNPGAVAMAPSATVAIAITLVHSLVDYPLRTAAIASLFAACCATIDRAIEL